MALKIFLTVLLLQFTYISCHKLPELIYSRHARQVEDEKSFENPATPPILNYNGNDELHNDNETIESDHFNVTEPGDNITTEYPSSVPPEIPDDDEEESNASYSEENDENTSDPELDNDNETIESDHFNVTEPGDNVTTEYPSSVPPEIPDDDEEESNAGYSDENDENTSDPELDNDNETIKSDYVNVTEPGDNVTTEYPSSVPPETPDDDEEESNASYSDENDENTSDPELDNDNETIGSDHFNVTEPGDNVTTEYPSSVPPETPDDDEEENNASYSDENDENTSDPELDNDNETIESDHFNVTEPGDNVTTEYPSSVPPETPDDDEEESNASYSDENDENTSDPELDNDNETIESDHFNVTEPGDNVTTEYPSSVPPEIPDDDEEESNASYSDENDENTSDLELDNDNETIESDHFNVTEPGDNVTTEYPSSVPPETPDDDEEESNANNPDSEYSSNISPPILKPIESDATVSYPDFNGDVTDVNVNATQSGDNVIKEYLSSEQLSGPDDDEENIDSSSEYYSCSLTTMPPPTQCQNQVNNYNFYWSPYYYIPSSNCYGWWPYSVYSESN